MVLVSLSLLLCLGDEAGTTDDFMIANNLLSCY